MTATGDRLDPFLGFRFQVRFDQESLGGFSEVSGIQVEVDVQDVPEGGVNGFVHKLPGRTRQGNLTLRRGLVSTAMWNWFAEVASGTVNRRIVAVELFPEDGEGKPIRWVFDGAFPSRWNGPDLKADQSVVAVEAIDLSHHGFLMET